MWLKFAQQYRHTPLCHTSILNLSFYHRPSLGTIIFYCFNVMFVCSFCEGCVNNLFPFSYIFLQPATLQPSTLQPALSYYCYFFNNYFPSFPSYKPKSRSYPISTRCPVYKIQTRTKLCILQRLFPLSYDNHNSFYE